MKRAILALAIMVLLLCAGAAAEDVLILPEDTKIIESEAFCETINVEKVVLPEGVEEIHSRAFANCALSEINLPESITFIADDAFINCKGAKFAAVEGSYAYDWAVENGYISFEPIVLGELTFLVGPHSATVTDCAADAVEVIVPERIAGVPVTGISEYAFEYCESLEAVSLPETIISIEPFAFYECKALKQIEIPAGVSELPDSAFRGCWSLSQITLHEGLRSIGYMCFENCWELTSIALPKGFVEIGISAFRNCQGLKQVSLPESLESIGTSAFSGCISIETLVIPRNIVSIGSGAFKGCNLTVMVPAGSSWELFFAMERVPYRTY